MRVLHAVLLLAIVSLEIHTGEDDAKISVSATGSISLLATDLEVTVTIQDKGEDAAAAMANLKAQREKIIGKLTEFGATSASIKDDTPVVMDPAQQQNQRQMMMARAGRLSRTKPEQAPKPEVQMQQALRAKFPLKGKDAAALVLEAEGVKSKLNPELTKLLKSSAAAELDEEDEMAAFQNQRGNTGPAYYFYSSANSEDVQSRALADALAKAKLMAVRTAKAMGKTDVALLSVAVQSGGEQGYQGGWDEYNEYGNRYNRMRMMMSSRDTLPSNTPEISAQASVSATFRPQ